MSKIVGIEEYKPHVQFPTLDGNRTVCPVSMIQDFIDEKETPLSSLEIRSIVADWLKTLGGGEMTAPQWISVDDELPENGVPVLILTGYGKQATSYYRRKYNLWVDWMRINHSYESVTHWMPLPEKPE